MKILLLGYEFSIAKPVIEVPKSPENKETTVKIKVSKCLYRDKRMFTREQASEEARLTKTPNIRIYCCEFCNMWHLTHKKRYRW